MLEKEEQVGTLKDISGNGNEGFETKGEVYGCGCGGGHKDNKGIGAWGGFFLGILWVLVALAMYGKFGSHEPKQEQGLKADMAELRVRVAEAAERTTADRKAVEKALQDASGALQETRQVIVRVVEKVQQIEGAHNALVTDMQNVISQNNRAVTTIDRVLREEYGKSKWFKMVKNADTDLAQEAAEVVKAQMKVKEEMQKAKTK